MSKENILSDSWVNGNTLNINISNLNDFNALLKNVEIKQKELQDAVLKLKRFHLSVVVDVID